MWCRWSAGSRYWSKRERTQFDNGNAQHYLRVPYQQTSHMLWKMGGIWRYHFLLSAKLKPSSRSLEESMAQVPGMGRKCHGLYWTTYHDIPVTHRIQVQDWSRKSCHLFPLVFPQPGPQSSVEQTQDFSSGSSMKRTLQMLFQDTARNFLPLAWKELLCCVCCHHQISKHWGPHHSENSYVFMSPV